MENVASVTTYTLECITLIQLKVRHILMGNVSCCTHLYFRVCHSDLINSEGELSKNVVNKLDYAVNITSRNIPLLTREKVLLSIFIFLL